jgi:peroxiredoxin
MMKKSLAIAVLGAVLFAGVFVAEGQAQFMFFRNPLLGREAPDFTLKSTQGDQVNFTEARSGKPALIFFWATWCPHCRDQVLDLAELAAELDEGGIRTFVIDVEESLDVVREYLLKNDLSLDVLLDTEANVALEYAVMGVPTYYLVNGDGLIVSADHDFPENYLKLLEPGA